MDASPLARGPLSSRIVTVLTDPIPLAARSGNTDWSQLEQDPVSLLAARVAHLQQTNGHGASNAPQVANRIRCYAARGCLQQLFEGNLVAYWESVLAQALAELLQSGQPAAAAAGLLEVEVWHRCVRAAASPAAARAVYYCCWGCTARLRRSPAVPARRRDLPYQLYDLLIAVRRAGLHAPAELYPGLVQSRALVTRCLSRHGGGKARLLNIEQQLGAVKLFKIQQQAAQHNYLALFFDGQEVFVGAGAALADAARRSQPQQVSTRGDSRLRDPAIHCGECQLAPAEPLPACRPLPAPSRHPAPGFHIALRWAPAPVTRTWRWTSRRRRRRRRRSCTRESWTSRCAGRRLPRRRRTRLGCAAGVPPPPLLPLVPGSLRRVLPLLDGHI
jgi:hypothetical protein